MKDWHPMAWIAYFSLGINSVLNILAAAKEKPPLANWLSPFTKENILGYGPAISFLIATIFFILELRRSRKSRTTVSQPMAIPASPLSQTSPTKTKKFYSERNKSDLANALTDLLEIFNRDGAEIIQKAQRIIEEWRPPGIADIVRGKKPPDIADIIEQLNVTGNLAATLYRDLFENNGFIKKYQTYSEELCPILQVNQVPSQTSNQPLIELQSGINFIRNLLASIKLAEKYNDQNLTKGMMTNTSSTFTDFQHKFDRFRGWVVETKRRITDFRDFQLK